jgi:hypothetical protein
MGLPALPITCRLGLRLPSDIPLQYFESCSM